MECRSSGITEWSQEWGNWEFSSLGCFEADQDVQDVAECVYCLETRMHSCLFPLLDRDL